MGIHFRIPLIYVHLELNYLEGDNCCLVLEEVPMAWSGLYPNVRLEGLRKTTKNFIEDDDVRVEFRTEHLPNRSLERYRCITSYMFSSHYGRACVPPPGESHFLLAHRS
jgi:hypothetical protein